MRIKIVNWKVAINISMLHQVRRQSDNRVDIFIFLIVDTHEENTRRI